MSTTQEAMTTRSSTPSTEATSTPESTPTSPGQQAVKSDLRRRDYADQEAMLSPPLVQKRRGAAPGPARGQATPAPGSTHEGDYAEALAIIRRTHDRSVLSGAVTYLQGKVAAYCNRSGLVPLDLIEASLRVASEDLPDILHAAQARLQRLNNDAARRGAGASGGGSSAGGRRNVTRAGNTANARTGSGGERTDTLTVPFGPFTVWTGSTPYGPLEHTKTEVAATYTSVSGPESGQDTAGVTVGRDEDGTNVGVSVGGRIGGTNATVSTGNRGLKITAEDAEPLARLFGGALEFGSLSTELSGDDKKVGGSASIRAVRFKGKVFDGVSVTFDVKVKLLGADTAGKVEFMTSKVAMKAKFGPPIMDTGEAIEFEIAASLQPNLAWWARQAAQTAAEGATTAATEGVTTAATEGTTTAATEGVTTAATEGATTAATEGATTAATEGVATAATEGATTAATEGVTTAAAEGVATSAAESAALTGGAGAALEAVGMVIGPLAIAGAMGAMFLLSAEHGMDVARVGRDGQRYANGWIAGYVDHLKGVSTPPTDPQARMGYGHGQGRASALRYGLEQRVPLARIHAWANARGSMIAERIAPRIRAEVYQRAVTQLGGMRRLSSIDRDVLSLAIHGRSVAERRVSGADTSAEDGS